MQLGELENLCQFCFILLLKPLSLTWPASAIWTKSQCAGLMSSQHVLNPETGVNHNSFTEGYPGILTPPPMDFAQNLRQKMGQKMPTDFSRPCGPPQLEAVLCQDDVHIPEPLQNMREETLEPPKIRNYSTKCSPFIYHSLTSIDFGSIIGPNWESHNDPLAPRFQVPPSRRCWPPRTKPFCPWAAGWPPACCFSAGSIEDVETMVEVIDKHIYYTQCTDLHRWSYGVCIYIIYIYYILYILYIYIIYILYIYILYIYYIYIYILYIYVYS